MNLGHFLKLLVASVALWAGVARGVDSPPAANLEFFEKKIRPLLVENCYKCHSVEAKKAKGDLVLDTRAGMLRGGSLGKPLVVPGDVEGSLLIEAVRWGNDELKMPPKKKLSDEQIADLSAWVKMGAPDPRAEPVKVAATATTGPSISDAAKNHWAFQPVKDRPVPSPQAGGSTAIDRFINAKLEERKLTPLGPAEKRVLIRRATYDLCGLPPTPEETDAFLADESPQAFAKVVDRLLGCKQYGEKWGRHWLDLARYADTAGESADFPVPEAYLYRNYVIDAFNADLPYDQFVREQIAGDLMESPDEAERERRIIATGFIATSKRFGVDPQHQMHLTIDDTIDTLGKSMLGLSLNCCRCHDHKFDPVTSKEYYSLYGFFASTRFPFPGSEEIKNQKDFVLLAPREQAEKLLAAYEAKLQPLEAEAAARKRAMEAEKGSPRTPELHRLWQEAANKVVEATAQGPGVPTAYALAEGKPHDAKILKRGEPYNQGDPAPRAFLTILGGQKLPANCRTSGRLELASWIADPKNPLTARVMVNRIWQGHFGKGIVSTPSDFGTRGGVPTHPELLDYLASRFIEKGWSIKSMHRMMMLTDAYQRRSEGGGEMAEKDGANDYLWRFDRRRLEAEEIRDSILAVSGDLDRSTGGPHPFPSKDSWRFTQHDAFSAVYETPRRSVYLMQQRIKKHPFLAMFDGADPNATTGARTSSTTPLQSLFMMNDPFVHAESLHFAARLFNFKEDAERLRLANLLCFNRPATEEDLADGAAYLKEYAEKAKGTAISESDRPKQAMAAYLRVLFSSNEFFFVD